MAHGARIRCDPGGALELLKSAGGVEIAATVAFERRARVAICRTMHPSHGGERPFVGRECVSDGGAVWMALRLPASSVSEAQNKHEMFLRSALTLRNAHVGERAPRTAVGLAGP